MDVQTQTEARKSVRPAHRVIFEFADVSVAVPEGHPEVAQTDGVDSLRFRSWLYRSANETGARSQ